MQRTRIQLVMFKVEGAPLMPRVRCLSWLTFMTFDYSEALNGLTADQRLHFYELLAHNLTIAVRAIWCNKDISDAEKVDRIRLVNEIQQRVTSKVYVLRLRLHEWTEEDTWKMIAGYVAQNRGIESDVNLAVKVSYDCAVGS
jgi:hypothetical protein